LCRYDGDDAALADDDWELEEKRRAAVTVQRLIRGWQVRRAKESGTLGGFFVAGAPGALSGISPAGRSAPAAPPGGGGGGAPVPDAATGTEWASGGGG
jgi:hypothetical protein